MLKRDFKTRDRDWELRCNHCRARYGFAGTTQFQRIVDWLRDNGWKARTYSQMWEHTCPKCQEAKVDARYLERLHA